jgi:hypothetical protein
MIVPGNHLQPSLMFASKAGAYPSVPTSYNLLIGQAPALPTNIRLGCKSLPGTNTLAYCKNLWITEKSIKTLGQYVPYDGRKMIVLLFTH